MKTKEQNQLHLFPENNKEIVDNGKNIKENIISENNDNGCKIIDLKSYNPLNNYNEKIIDKFYSLSNHLED